VRALLCATQRASEGKSLYCTENCFVSFLTLAAGAVLEKTRVDEADSEQIEQVEKDEQYQRPLEPATAALHAGHRHGNRNHGDDDGKEYQFGQSVLPNPDSNLVTNSVPSVSRMQRLRTLRTLIEPYKIFETLAPTK
jgi:hypothetical protein